MADKFDGSITIRIYPDDDIEKLPPEVQAYALRQIFRHDIPSLLATLRHLADTIKANQEILSLTSLLDKYYPHYSQKTKKEYELIAKVYRTMCDENQKAYKNGISDKLLNVNAENLRDRLNILISEGKLRIKPRKIRTLNTIIAQCKAEDEI